jgi:rubrerythrin
MAAEQKLSALDILKLALEKEKGSFSSLSRAGNASGNKQLKKTLNRLALQELNHILMLMDLSQVSPVDPLGEIDLSFQGQEPGTGMLNEETALRACMSSELESINLYMDLVNRAQEQEDDDVLRLLQQLVEEEKEHKRILEELMEKRLKEI